MQLAANINNIILKESLLLYNVLYTFSYTIFIMESKSMELALLAILITLAWFWLDSMSKRERAILLGRELAARFNLQLLDETVACNKLWLARNSRGKVLFLRTYEFDVSASRVDRLPCQLTLLGDQLGSWHIPPYEQPD